MKKVIPATKRPLLTMCIAFMATLMLILSIGYITVESVTLLLVKNTEKSAPQVESLALTSFPVGVDPREETITENLIVDAYFKEHIGVKEGTAGAHTSWLHRALGKIALSSVFQNLASVSSRILVIDSGERREEVAEHFGKILGWDRAMRDQFLESIATTSPALHDGKFFPGTYVVARKATPEEVIPLINARFEKEILARYTPEVEAVVPLEDALTIASLLEREAYDFEDMRQIAGVIWNRLFIDMNLQLDATLQYAKGSDANEPWWPRVRPADKYIESPFNTYENNGLPPSPIANPSLDAVLAALNPKKTNCMFYFHDSDGGFHCSATYEEHVRMLKEIYGRGK